MPNFNWRHLIIALKKSPFGAYVGEAELQQIQKIYATATSEQIEEAIKKIDHTEYNYRKEIAAKEKLAEKAADKLNQAIYTKTK